MSFYCPKKYQVDEIPDVNKELAELKGELEDKQAQITLARFLRANLGFTVELISGIKLAPYQELTLKAFFLRNFCMCVWGRGCSKSFVAAIFCFIYLIFEPRTKILIAGPTFRTARNIFTELEKIVNSPEAKLLAQCFDAKPSKRNDLFEWSLNGGSIKAIPLNGEKIRGIRANVLLIDEFLLMAEDIVERVLMPYLMASKDIKERISIREEEDELIKKGKMKEEERIQFGSSSKMIVLSSACYTFEYLYKKHQEWLEKIHSDDEVKDAKYFISQLSYQAIPEVMWDKTIIEEAKNGGTSHSAFQREYEAQFTDDSDSYFSAKKMGVCTIPDGQFPHLELAGEQSAKYILSVDASFSNSDTSDNFAMCVQKLDEKGFGAVVHNYAVAGGNLKDHISYYYYLITHFNIVMIILDSAGGRQFIDAANLSPEFKKNNWEYKFFDFDSDKAGMVEYNQVLKEARNQYNLQDKKICVEQRFTSDFIRNANELLQANIDHKRVWFASKITPNEGLYESMASLALPTDLMNHLKGNSHGEKMIELIDEQDILISTVKKECALIEVKSTAKGTQSFDLPLHLLKSKSANRARKDSYTALMLGNWGIKVYKDMMTYEPVKVITHYIPIMIH